MIKPCKAVILISGNGSNLQAIIDAFKGDSVLDIIAVISNKADAYGLERAKKSGITTHFIDHRLFDSRDAFDQALALLIDQYNPDLLILAGFMRILTADFVNHYLGRMINLHPSLLPKYPGLNTHKRALEAGDEEHGCSIHFVTPMLDGGPIILQHKLSITEDMNEQALATLVHQLEHESYPLVIRWFAEKRLALDNNKVMLDKKPLSTRGFQYDTDH